MITKRKLRERLQDRKTQLFNLDKAWENYILGDNEYHSKRPILEGQIKELEDLCHINKK